MWKDSFFQQKLGVVEEGIVSGRRGKLSLR